MKKFKFQYESVLRVRKTREDLAKRSYATALENQTRVEKELQRIYESIEKSRERSLQLQKTGGRDAHFAIQIASYIEGAYQQADRKKDEIERLSSITQAEHAKYMQSYRERKAMEKLSEKQETRYKKEVQKKQTKAAEDIVMARFARDSSED